MTFYSIVSNGIVGLCQYVTYPLPYPPFNPHVQEAYGVCGNICSRFCQTQLLRRQTSEVLELVDNKRSFLKKCVNPKIIPAVIHLISLYGSGVVPWSEQGAH